MNRRGPAQIVAENISAAQNAAGVQLDPALIPASRELTYGDLLDIGGVLRVSPASLMQGVPSA